MFQVLSLLVLIVGAILPFFVKPYWGWVPLALLDFIIIASFWAARSKYRFRSMSELSTDANFLLQKYGHYFAMPFGSKDFSAASATSQFGGMVIAIICAFKGFWGGIALAVVNWAMMGTVAVSLSPLALLDKRPELRLAHDEVVEFLNAKRQEHTASE